MQPSARPCRVSTTGKSCSYFRRFITGVATLRYPQLLPLCRLAIRPRLVQLPTPSNPGHKGRRRDLHILLRYSQLSVSPSGGSRRLGIYMHMQIMLVTGAVRQMTFAIGAIIETNEATFLSSASLGNSQDHPHWV